MGHFKTLLLLNKKKGNFSQPIVRLTILGVMLGIVIMIIAVAITSGYKQAIRNKVIGVDSHIRISNYDRNTSLDPIPINKDENLRCSLLENPNIENINYFTTKVAIVKSNQTVEGTILKGIDNHFAWKNFSNYIIEGEPLPFSEDSTSRQIIISTRLANKLNLQLGDNITTYFVQDPPRQRKLTVCAIYETGLPDYDNQIALVDLKMLQEINGWTPSQVGGMEIRISDYQNIDEMGIMVHQNIGYNLKAETIKQLYPNIFQWIALFDTNVIVLMVIIIAVCLITITSTFFIIVLEETKTIGILKTLGMGTKQIFHLFLMIALKLIGKGILYGNAIALSLCLLQYHFHFIKLDAATYYLSYVPIAFPIGNILLINLGILLLCLGTLSIPALYISQKITPINAIRFD